MDDGAGELSFKDREEGGKVHRRVLECAAKVLLKDSFHVWIKLSLINICADCSMLNDVGILPRQEQSSWGFVWPFVTHKMSLCVHFFTGQGARAEQSTQLPRDPDAWRLVTRETSEALQKCCFPQIGKLLACFMGRIILFFVCELFLSITAGHLVVQLNQVFDKVPTWAAATELTRNWINCKLEHLSFKV